jgi:3-mercaptopyruvate sulfurtransferase SseA
MTTFEDKNSNFKYTIPTLEEFVKRMEKLNVGIDDTVICYENTPN